MSLKLQQYERESVMRPSQVSGILRNIASKIENSKNPSVSLVTQDLRRVITAMKFQDMDLDIFETIDLLDNARKNPASQLMWLAFGELKKKDWEPNDTMESFLKVKKKVEEIGAALGCKDLSRAMTYLHDNYAGYQKLSGKIQST